MIVSFIYGEFIDKGVFINIVWYEVFVGCDDCLQQCGYCSVIFWFIGFFGFGKSIFVNVVNVVLFEWGFVIYVLDGDNICYGFCKDLGFFDVDCEENICCIGEVVKLFLDVGVIVLIVFVFFFCVDWDKVWDLVEDGDFFEVFCVVDLEVCEFCDFKGFYVKVWVGQIKEFIGIFSFYEVLEMFELKIDIGKQDLVYFVELVIKVFQECGVILVV